MTLQELKDWVNSLPEEFNEFTVCNAEFSQIDEQYMYRLDKPITMLTVSEGTNEILIMNDAMDNDDDDDDELIKSNDIN
jgi:hypothetical protein